MMTADERVERLADKLQQFAARSARQGGVKAKLAQPLAEDADFLRKLKPSLVKARARGEAPPPTHAASTPQVAPRPRPTRKNSASGPSPWLVVGVAFAAGIVLAKVIDWRGHAHPRD